MKIIERKEVIKFIVELVIIVLVTTFVFSNIIIPVSVDGESMYPTIHDNDTAIVDAVNIDKDGIKRFDIVVVYSKTLNKKIIKRVIGLPGDKIVFKADKLYINDKLYEETYLNKEYMEEVKIKYNKEYFTEDFQKTLKDDEIFVMGDNRHRSTDSRNLGPFHYSDILGKKGLVIFPFSNVKWID